MPTKGWRPVWNTPGQSESKQAILDLIIHRNLTVKGKIIQGNVYTVATLPSSANLGDRGFVTDTFDAKFNDTPKSGGADIVPIFWNGTEWIVG
jgi:hypothetical protein